MSHRVKRNLLIAAVVVIVVMSITDVLLFVHAVAHTRVVFAAQTGVRATLGHPVPFPIFGHGVTHTGEGRHAVSGMIGRWSGDTPYACTVAETDSGFVIQDMNIDGNEIPIAPISVD